MNLCYCLQVLYLFLLVEGFCWLLFMNNFYVIPEFLVYIESIRSYKLKLRNPRFSTLFCHLVCLIPHLGVLHNPEV